MKVKILAVGSWTGRDETHMTMPIIGRIESKCCGFVVFFLNIHVIGCLDRQPVNSVVQESRSSDFKEPTRVYYDPPNAPQPEIPHYDRQPCLVDGL